MSNLFLGTSFLNSFQRCFLAEMLGTFMLVLLGESSVAQAVLTKKDTIVTIVGNGTIGTFTTQKDSLNNFLTIILGHCVSNRQGNVYNITWKISPISLCVFLMQTRISLCSASLYVDPYFLD